MGCRECAAEVAATARVCSRCGAPIVGQPTVVADTVVADTVVGAVSDTAVSDSAGKAVAAGTSRRRCRSRTCRVPALASPRSFGYCRLDTVASLSLASWPAPRLLPFLSF